MLQWGAMTELRHANLQDCFYYIVYIGDKLNKDKIGLNRDDGLAYFKNNNGHRTIKLGKN